MYNTFSFQKTVPFREESRIEDSESVPRLQSAQDTPQISLSKQRREAASGGDYDSSADATFPTHQICSGEEDDLQSIRQSYPAGIPRPRRQEAAALRLGGEKDH
jgi:hypothetical protein